MIPYAFAIVLMTIVWMTVIYLNERRNLLSADQFASAGMKYFAYGWLGFFLILLCVLVANSAKNPAQASDLARTPFYALFSLHAILIMFLAGWWIATSRPPLRQFLNIQREGAGEAVLTGLAVGVGGWIFTLVVALTFAAILSATGLIDKPQPSPVIGFMAALPFWKKVVLVLSAMTVEEAFFRSWLQKRIGLIASTVLFAMAHFTLGQPLLLIGVAMISLVIGFTFYRTKNVIPGVIAHGVFDAVQLFVIIPIAFKLTGL
jgi:membrane protease YdiL (CAAX protease family)